MEEEVRERVSTLEAVLGEFIVQTNKSLKRMEDSTQVFREEVRRDQQQRDTEMREFKQEMTEFKDEMRQDRQDLNKKWGELANKMGTIAEDISAPNMKTVAQQYFNCEGYDTFAVRVSRRSQRNRKYIQEFDVVLTSGDYLFINETKSSPKVEHTQQFSDKLQTIFDYLPEYKGKTVIPIFSSLSIPEVIVEELTKQSIYAMSMGGETMELLNYQALQKK
ncbi:MAG: hypothetical protein AAF944_09880 [Bacteroidota bacterium]